MDFKMIDKNTVQCILSEDEMNSFGYQVEDFFSNQDKAKEFLEQLVEKAEDELGYEATGNVVSMQVMKLPNNDLCITFSDKDPVEGFQSIMQNLQERIMGCINESLAGEFTDEDDYGEMFDEELMKNMQQGMDDKPESYKKALEKIKKKEQKEKQKQKEQREFQVLPKVYRFESLRDVEMFVATIPAEINLSSSLYKNVEDESYYLFVKKGKLKKQEYIENCQKIEEFATLERADEFAETYCKEHYITYIPKKAVQVLRKIEMA